MKNIILLISLSVLTACSFSGFMPPQEQYYWHLPGNDLTLDEYIDKKHKEMRECGIDPFEGYHKNLKEGLCMEKKGWVYTQGPMCEYEYYKNDPACDDWQRKHGN